MRRLAARLGAGLLLAALAAAVSGPVAAQAPARPVPPVASRGQSVAEIRAELEVLNGQVQQLRDELVQRSAARGLPAEPATALTRLDQLQDELRRLTDRVDVLTNDLDRIIQDASNRVGDIEFRLTELEGGDTALVGTPEPLGGGLTRPKPRPVLAAPGGADDGAPELAVSERADYDAAVAAAAAGDNRKAADLFGSFASTYPGGPLSSDAQFRRGESLAALGDWSGAARSYLDTFSGAPAAPLAPKALLRLGESLDKLGKRQDACLTLNEVGIRYPGSDVAADVAARQQEFACP